MRWEEIKSKETNSLSEQRAPKRGWSEENLWSEEHKGWKSKSRKGNTEAKANTFSRSVPFFKKGAFKRDCTVFHLYALPSYKNRNQN